MSQPGPMGWGVSTMTEQQRHKEEKMAREKLANDAPTYLMRQVAKPIINQALLTTIQDEIKAAGWDDGFGFRWLFKAIMKESPGWLAQLIGSCFQAGTLIRMADGSHKPIEKIRLFDKVLTAEGNQGYVTATMGREAEELMYSIKLWGHKAVEMTGEHPVLTRRGYVKAGELTLQDYVAVPKYIPESTSVLQTELHVIRNGQAIRRSNKQAVGSRSVSRAYALGERENVPVYRTVPDMIDLSPEFGRLCGLFLAEGHADTNKIVFTFNKDEEDTLVAETVRLWKDLFDVEAVVSFPSKQGKRLPEGGREVLRTTCKVTVHSTPWAQVFRSTMGHKSAGKMLHADLSSGPKGFLESVLGGWLDGDGCDKKDRVNQGVSVSRRLSLDMHAVANAIGLMPSLCQSDSKASHGVKSRQRRYDIYIRDTENRLCCEEESGVVWRKVREISSRDYKGKVYNFEVHGDNSYVAEGLGVHNCVASGDMRTTAYRMMAEVFLLNDPEQLPGVDIDGRDSLAFFAPFSYRAGRREAGINGNGDGSLCLPHIRGKMKYGHLPCSASGLNSDAFPEPQSQRSYKEWGANNRLMDQFLAEAGKYKLLESEPVKTPQDAHELICEHFKPQNICSMWGFKSLKNLGVKDTSGGILYQWSRSGQWAHNMSIVGCYKLRGNRYFEVENSWSNFHNGNQSFLVEENEFAQWLNRAECQSVGEIDMQDNSPTFPG